ncbi:MAG: short-chain dehydrogenase, partial [Thiogranum sp.]
RNIDTENSVHRQAYLATGKRLAGTAAGVPFTLPPEAVLDKVIKALQSRKPRPRYYVTFPTHLFGTLKRLLSTRSLDRILLRISRNEQK